MPLGEWRSIGYSNALSFIFLIFLIPTFGLLFQVERSWKLEKKVRGLSIWWQGGSPKKVAKRKKFAKKYHYFSLRLNMLCFQLNMSY